MDNPTDQIAAAYLVQAAIDAQDFIAAIFDMDGAL